MMGWDGESLAMPLLLNNHVISGLNTHWGWGGAGYLSPSIVVII